MDMSMKRNLIRTVIRKMMIRKQKDLMTSDLLNFQEASQEIYLVKKGLILIYRSHGRRNKKFQSFFRYC